MSLPTIYKADCSQLRTSDGTDRPKCPRCYVGEPRYQTSFGQEYHVGGIMKWLVDRRHQNPDVPEDQRWFIGEWVLVDVDRVEFAARFTSCDVVTPEAQRAEALLKKSSED